MKKVSFKFALLFAMLCCSYCEYEELDVFDSIGSDGTFRERFRSTQGWRSFPQGNLFKLSNLLVSAPVKLAVLGFLCRTLSSLFLSVYSKNQQNRFEAIQREQQDIWTVLLNLHNKVVQLREETTQDIDKTNSLIKSHLFAQENARVKLRLMENQLAVIKRNEKRIVKSIQTIRKKLRRR